MPNGYATPLLQHIEAVAGTNPAKKLAPLGMTSMILSAMDGSAELLNQRYDSGHQRDLNVKFRKRVLESAVSDIPSACDTGNTPVYNEFSLPGLQYREYALFVPDSLIRQYTKDASQFITVDNGVANIRKQTNAMNEVYEMFIEAGGAVLKSINRALVTDMATQFGVNTVTGNNATRALSFSLGTTGMNDAMVQLIADWRENELADNVMIVGNGAFANYDLIKTIMSNPSAQGINQAQLAQIMPKVFFDKDTRAVWGANQCGVFEKGSAHLLTRNMYTGSFARTIANSTYFTMALPANEYTVPVEHLDKLAFDVQVKEFDCPTELSINGGEPTQTSGPGILIVLSKYFKLFTKPGNLFEATDPLYNTNGTLRYTITAS